MALDSNHPYLGETVVMTWLGNTPTTNRLGFFFGGISYE
jgi:hypothetical protein